MTSDVVYLAPVESGATGTFPIVHAGADSLESQADGKVKSILQIFDDMSSDPWVKQQILTLQGFIDQGDISDEEVSLRIERGVALILGYISNQFVGSQLPVLESIYPGFTEQFFRYLRSHVESLVTSARRLLESDWRISSVRQSIQASILELLERSRASFNHQKWEGAYNLRGFRHYRAKALHGLVRRLWSKEDADPSPVHCAQIMIDLDKFKDVNDRYGLSAGDEVLRDFLHILQRTLRDSDLIGMPGGDEYFLFLPDTDEAGALKLASRIVEAFEAYTFCVHDRDELEVALDGLEEKPKIGMSTGVATIVFAPTPTTRQPRTTASLFGGLEVRLDQESEKAMEGAKVLDKPNGGNGGGTRRNGIMTFDQASAREAEIVWLIALKSARRSGS